MNEAVLPAPSFLFHVANSSHIQAAAFAVASDKRNADFHELFKAILEGEYLIEGVCSRALWRCMVIYWSLVYGYALQRETPVRGRVFISENHICVHANIFGWATNVRKHSFELSTFANTM